MSEIPIILIVEDKPDHSDLMKTAVTKELKDAQIIQASTASECLRVISDIDINLIFLFS